MAPMEHDPLAAYLDALARDDCYRVAQVLKTAPHETTEVVYFVGANAAELGPFVRKRISVEASMGDAYGHLLAAQRAGRRFRHLPRIYDVHESDGDMVVVMEYVAGRTLRDEVYERDASLELARRWFPLLCDGVSELHEQFPAPIIHRDLKPTNVVVGGEGLTIIDFGIARAFRDGAESDTSHFGTRSYAPPEQFGFRQTDVRSDVYALGMILYYLLTEKDPSPVVAAEGFADPAVPASLRPVLARACAFDPAARFQSARDLKAAFLAACDALEKTTEKEARRPSARECGASSTHRATFEGFAPKGEGLWRTSSGWRRASLVVGAVWDVLVVLFWVLFVSVCIAAVLVPNEADKALPLWFRWAEYVGFAAVFVTGLCYLALDKRLLREKIPFMANQTFLRGLAVGGIIAATGLAVLAVCVFLVSFGVVDLPVR